MFRTFDSPAQPLTYIYYDYTLHILLHKSPTPTPNGGLQYWYRSCDIDIAVVQNGTAISPAVPNPYTKWGLQYDIAAAISPSVPNHPHAAMLKIFFATITAETMMWP